MRTSSFVRFSAFAMLLAAAVPARAQGEQDNAQRADFLFGHPRGWISLSGTALFPRAEGDLYKFFSDQLTIDRSDYRAGALTTSFGIVLLPQLDVVGDLEFSRRTIGSTYRHFVKADRSEIRQTTHMNQTALGVGFRYAPVGRGREISNYAFIPRRVVPWVGAGMSVVYIDLLQTGQFVDFVDSSIFNHGFTSNGWSVGPHVDAGTDVQIWRALSLTVGARYTWARSTLDQDFVGFDGIDLAGLRGSTGFTVVF